MSKPKQIVLRVQSPDGTKRVEVSSDDSISRLFEKIYETFNLESFGFGLFRQRNQIDELRSSRSRNVKDVGLSHGDMLYLVPSVLDSNNGTVLWDRASTSSASNCTPAGSPLDAAPSTSRGSKGQIHFAGNVQEDEVDLQLWKQDGKIQRKKDEKLCRHGVNGCCIHCSPLEPFNESYLKEQNIKHLSFHSYLRKLTGGVDRGKFQQLEDISCRIKSGCKDHPPWPRGFCSKCQPNAITLNRQHYRHVDNVMFENASLVERFLNYWRSTGHQRIGYLYGRYEIHTDVPLGIRAVVVAIYEPPQVSAKDSLQLVPDGKAALVDELAHSLNLRKIGWIFTHLIADDIKKGTVKHVRNGENYFLSAQECITAGHLQNENPNPCRFSPTGYFGSKHVTVCVTGDDKNQVHMEGYQVSNQCMALVRDGCLVPTKDAPELGYVIESSDKQYVPDVYYKEKDSYGNEVQKLARPLPVEYLLVDVPAATPRTPQCTFYINDEITPFPVENRLVDGHVQEFHSLCTYMKQFSPDQFLEAMSDFHLLLFIASMDMLPMKDHMAPLLEAIRTNDRQKTLEWAHSEHWATVEQLISAASGSSLQSMHGSSFGNNTASSSAAAGVGIGVGTGSAEQEQEQTSWTCRHCTFINPADLNMCEMCSLPRFN